MFNTDFIGVYDNALTSYQCKEIIKWTETQSLVKGKVLEDNQIKEKLEDKDDWEVDATKTNFQNKTFVDLMIRDALFKSIGLYRKSHPEIGHITPWDLYDDFNIQKYNPGECYHALHCENAGGSDIMRVMAWMIYLNTVTDKGGTYFSSYNRTIKPKEGRLVIWPAYFTHYHRGVVSKTQTKYIATGWYNFTNVLLLQA